MTDWESLSVRDLAMTCEILRLRAGSHAYGLNTPQSDEDFLGVMVEPKTYVMGLATFGTWDNNTGSEKNGPGDVDLVIHSVRKFLRLACSGNPNVIEKFFAHPKDIIHISDGGNRLMGMGPMFSTQKAAKAYLGYLKAQRQKATGERTQRTQRTDLISEHGYDVKFAMHMLRLGYMGCEYLETGEITLPMESFMRRFLLSVRAGNYRLNDLVDECRRSESKIQWLLDHDELRPEPNIGHVNKALIEIHEWWWSQVE